MNQFTLAAELIELLSPDHSLTSGQLAQCQLTADSFTWQTRHKTQVLSIQDILGVSALASHQTVTGFVIQACPRLPRYPWSRTSHRTLKTYVFACPRAQVQNDWLQALQTLLAAQQLQSPKRLLVLLNPQSGQGQACQCWQRIEPLFKHSQIKVTLIVPAHREQLSTELAAFQPSDYDGLVVIGGDGTVHDVLNHLSQRPDAQTALRLPLGIIPAGTGNGLCKSILTESGEPCDALSAAFVIAKGQPQTIDLIQVKQANRTVTSMISFAWGLISDIDLESEKFRWLGPLRNDIYSLWYILRLRSYPGEFHFKTTVYGPWESRTGLWITLWGLNIPWATQTVQAAPHVKLADGTLDILSVRAGVSRWQLLRAFLKISTGDHLQLACIETVKVCHLRFVPHDHQGHVAIDGERFPTETTELVVNQGLGQVFGRLDT